MPDNTQSISSQAGNGSEAAQEKAKEVASQAHDKAREAAGQARGRIRDQVDHRSTQLGERVGEGVGDARSVAGQLRQQGKETPARYVDQAAERAERLGGYLRETDGDRMLNDVEDFVRRNPWAVALGGLTVGFAASRLLKASSSDRYRDSLQRSDAGELSSSQSLGITDGHSAPVPATAPATGTVGASAGTGGDQPRIEE